MQYGTITRTKKKRNACFYVNSLLPVVTMIQTECTVLKIVLSTGNVYADKAISINETS